MNIENIISPFSPFRDFSDFEKSTFNLSDHTIKILVKSIIQKPKAHVVNSHKPSFFHIISLKTNNLFYLSDEYELKDDPNHNATKLFFKNYSQILTSYDTIRRFDYAKVIRETFLQNKIDRLTIEQAYEVLKQKRKLASEKNYCSFFLIRQDSDSNEFIMNILSVKKGKPNFSEIKIDFNAKDEKLLEYFYISERNLYVKLNNIILKNEFPLPPPVTLNIASKNDLSTSPPPVKKVPRDLNSAPEHSSIPVKKRKSSSIVQFDTSILHVVSEEELAVYFANEPGETWALVYFQGNLSPVLVIKEFNGTLTQISFPTTNLNEIKHFILSNLQWCNRFNNHLDRCITNKTTPLPMDNLGQDDPIQYPPLPDEIASSLFN